MLINEIEHATTNLQLIALVQYFLGKSNHLRTDPTIKTDTFVEFANKLGLNVSIEQLQSLFKTEPFKDLVSDINQDTNKFVGARADAPVSIDHAHQIVKAMAKRALKS